MNITPKPASSSNYATGRPVPIDMIVIHVMQGYPKGTALRFADPEARASAHYGIGVDGMVYQYVSESDTAWHAGNAIYNRRSVGIELEGFIDDPACFTPEMMAALTDLCRAVVARWSVPVDRAHIIGHCEVPDPYDHTLFGGHDHHIDPGPDFPIDAFVAGLAGANQC